MLAAPDNAEQVDAIVVGGGPAGLMAAEALADAGVQVLVCDAMPALGRKLLRAGVGGLNLTHSEADEQFSQRFLGSVRVADWLPTFGADQVRAWVAGLGIATYVGSSGRVFPEQFKASPLLRAWLTRLADKNIEIRTRYRWRGWEAQGDRQLHYFDAQDGRVAINSRVTILALGGGSWARLGSDGLWLSVLQSMGVRCHALEPSNCGFQYAWSNVFKEQFAGMPLKSVALSVSSASGTSLPRSGEAMLTQYGMEGGLIYAVSAAVRQELKTQGVAMLYWDLLPQKSLSAVVKQLSVPIGKMTLSTCLRKRLGLSPLKISLLRELVPERLSDMSALAHAIKRLPMSVHSLRPLDEAISSAGGVCGSELTHDLMLKQCAGVFCAGEMLDWDAPTGGYLLTAVLASGLIAGRGAQRYLQQDGKG